MIHNIMNANDHARSLSSSTQTVYQHKPLPRCCVENGRLGRSRQLPAPTLQPWPTSCLNSSCDSNLRGPSAYITSNTCSFSMAAVLSIAKVFWRSSKCYSVTARALKQDTAISDSSGSFFGGAGARRAKACERIRIHPRMSSVRSRQTAQMHIWSDLTYCISSILVWTSWCILYDRREKHVWKQWSRKSKISGTWWL